MFYKLVLNHFDFFLLYRHQIPLLTEKSKTDFVQDKTPSPEKTRVGD